MTAHVLLIVGDDPIPPQGPVRMHLKNAASVSQVTLAEKRLSLMERKSVEIARAVRNFLDRSLKPDRRLDARLIVG